MRLKPPRLIYPSIYLYNTAQNLRLYDSNKASNYRPIIRYLQKDYSGLNFNYSPATDMIHYYTEYFHYNYGNIDSVAGC